MKHTILIVITLVALASASSSIFDFNVKECLRNFLKEVRGKDVQLDDKCFGDSFKKDMANVKKYVDTDNYSLIMINLGKMSSYLLKSCPIEEVKSIINNAMESIQKLSFNEITEIIRIAVVEYKNKQQTDATIGTALGKIFKIMQKKSLVTFENLEEEINN